MLECIITVVELNSFCLLSTQQICFFSAVGWICLMMRNPLSYIHHSVEKWLKKSNFKIWQNIWIFRPKIYPRFSRFHSNSLNFRAKIAPTNVMKLILSAKNQIFLLKWDIFNALFNIVIHLFQAILAFHTFCNRWTEMENKQDVKDLRCWEIIACAAVCLQIIFLLTFISSIPSLIGKIVMKGHNNNNSRFCWVNHVFVRLCCSIIHKST